MPQSATHARTDTPWTIADAMSTYSVAGWGEGYFSANPAGHVQVDVGGQQADLKLLVEELIDNGIRLPMLLRFNNILRDRVKQQRQAFADAIAALDYQGAYTPVYPIKVNQQHTVVEQLLQGDDHLGLEAGSKPELMAVLGIAPKGATIVCNGYKDREYIRVALIAQKLGHRVFIVLEQPSELDLVFAEAASLEVQPNLGVRVRLATLGKGYWQNTGGEKAKFGHSATQLLATVERLKADGQLTCLKLLHFHLGSQVANLNDIRNGLREAARFYADLHALGANIEVADVGGGLGVDYEGNRSRSSCSMNYSLDDYAHAVVEALHNVAQRNGLPEPEIITESGRALTAHHAVLVTEVIEVERNEAARELTPLADDADDLLKDMQQALLEFDVRPVLELYYDASQWLGEARSLYNSAHFTLAERAHAEQLYFALIAKVQTRLDPAVRSHRDIVDELNEKLADKYFCNFSVFQSLPDVWALDQVFPIMPLHRLHEAPTQRASLQDLTCDSDGCIGRYVEGDAVESTLPLHDWQPGQDYWLGMFMVGAYQEILGDIHNLFGDTHSVSVELTADGYRITDRRVGDRVDELLEYVQFSPDQLRMAYAAKLRVLDDKALRSRLLAELEAGLTGYTYLEDD